LTARKLKWEAGSFKYDEKTKTVESEKPPDSPDDSERKLGWKARSGGWPRLNSEVLYPSRFSVVEEWAELSVFRRRRNSIPALSGCKMLLLILDCPPENVRYRSFLPQRQSRVARLAHVA